MKINSINTEVICHIDKEGKINPIRMRFSNSDESNIVLKIDKVITIDDDNFAGNKMIAFKCQSIVNNKMIEYILKYEIRTCKWLLFLK